MPSTRPISQREIFRFWLPLAATWLMMSVEGPFLAAVIARLDDPKINLAAYGVAFSLGMLFESPIILIMSAATRLVEHGQAYRALRNFTFLLNGGITGAMLVMLIPQVFQAVFEGMVGLPHEVALRAYQATWILLPWPAAIGYRRLYQGVLIRSGRTRMVAYGTVVRLLGTTCASLFAAWGLGAPGAVAGAVGMTAGVVGEAVAARVMAGHSLKALSPELPESPLTYGRIWVFYLPLALTSVLNLGVHPMVTFFLGQSRLALESLAVMPVVHSLTFFFGSGGLALQETTIALLGPKRENAPALQRFALTLAAVLSGALLLLAFTPLANLWLTGVAGLTAALATVALLPVRVLSLQPAMTVAQCFQRAVLVSAKTTRAVTEATVVEVTAIVAVLWVAVYWGGWVGATAAAAALFSGRLASVLYQLAPVRRVLARQ